MHPPRVLKAGDDYAFNTLIRKQLPPSASNFLAFYSSALGHTIVTDPAYMSVAMDEHMVHRGHAVFDTCNVVKGRAYGISFHVARLLRSAKLARIVPRFTADELRIIILSTIAAAGQQDDVFVRFWMTAGRGDFSVSSRHTYGSNFLVMVHKMKTKIELKNRGVKEFIVSVPLKPPLLATVKSNNYLLNALACEESEDKGGYLGIQVDEQGKIAESSIGNVAILDNKGYLRTPPFGKILAGTTVKRLGELVAPSLVESGMVNGFVFDDLVVEDLMSAKEVYSLGGGGIVPVVAVNGTQIGDGRPGPVFRELEALLQWDMEDGEYLDDIPYEEYAGGSWLTRAKTSAVRAIVKHKWMLITFLAYSLGYRAGLRKSVIFYL